MPTNARALPKSATAWLLAAPLSWRGETADGGRSRAGAYVYRFTLGAQETRGKLVLLR